MKDTIIKGDGTSRTIRAPESMPETYAAWREQLINGEGMLDIGLNADGCDVVGTPLNKQNLLKDTTAQALGVVGNDPTPDDAFNAVRTYAGQIAEEKAAAATDAKMSVEDVFSDDYEWRKMAIPFMPTKVFFNEIDGDFYIIDDGTNARKSSDGRLWEDFTMGISTDSYDRIFYINGRFFANSTGSNLYVSDDFQNWRTVALPIARSWGGIAYGDGQYVITSYNGGDVAAYSPDGETWLSSFMPATANWYSVVHGAGVFVAFSKSNVNYVAYSTNGINWVSVTLPVTSDWKVLYYFNGLFYLLDASNYYISANGLTWTFGGNLPTTAEWSSFGVMGNAVLLTASTGSVLRHSESGYEAIVFPETMTSILTISSADKLIVAGLDSDTEKCYYYYSRWNYKLMQQSTDKTRFAFYALDIASAISENVKFVIGTYRGNGGGSQAINLGFYPKAVHVCCANYTEAKKHYSGIATRDTPMYDYSGLRGKALEVSKTGFVVYGQHSSPSVDSMMNINTYVYNYIAFK